MVDFIVPNNFQALGTIKDSTGATVVGAPTVEVSKNSAAAVGTRRTLNLIEGTNITLTIADDAGGDEIDVTIAGSGGATADEVWEHATADADNAGTFGRVLNEWEDGGRLDVLLDAIPTTTMRGTDSALTAMGTIINSIQRGSINVDTSETATISAVVMAKSFVNNLGWDHDGTTSVPNKEYVRLDLQSTTLVRAQRDNSTDTCIVQFEVVEFI